MTKPIIEVKGKKCILFVNKDPGLGTTTFAVPVDVAEDLNLFSYDGEELYKNHRLLFELGDYEIENIYTYTTE